MPKSIISGAIGEGRAAPSKPVAEGCRGGAPAALSAGLAARAKRRLGADDRARRPACGALGARAGHRRLVGGGRQDAAGDVAACAARGDHLPDPRLGIGHRAFEREPAGIVIGNAQQKRRALHAPAPGGRTRPPGLRLMGGCGRGASELPRRRRHRRRGGRLRAHSFDFRDYCVELPVAAMVVGVASRLRTAATRRSADAVLPSSHSLAANWIWPRR